MIENIFEMLHLTQHYAQGKLIEIAKGKYKLPSNWKETKEQIKRDKAWQKKQ